MGHPSVNSTGKCHLWARLNYPASRTFSSLLHAIFCLPETFASTMNGGLNGLTLCYLHR